MLMGLVALVTGGTMALVGCERDQKAYGVDRDRDPKKTNVDRDSESNRDRSGVAVSGDFNGAVQSIAQARCAREERCKNLGPNHKYESKTQCVAGVRNDNADDLNAEECKGGVDKKELGECLEAIRSEDCNSPLDTIGRLAACRTSDMCRATTAPNH
jgi:hypothetical protein